ncbi:SusC/RagA family TonB-linked outer membrane protein [Saccharicrinis sp. 156]|uniref:SusC/RagA family TonB-linked outer membrane protein n=1 Tax=Saccharicrinis sp. 156 TaxID=3417574 RepID=UPI003D34692B
MKFKEMLKKGCLILFFVCMQLSLFAQDIQVTGEVLDSSGEPIPGVNVSIQGTTTGTITTFDGVYTIEAPANGKLQFSFIGFQQQMVEINGRKTIDISLAEDLQDLEEVVVVGYGTTKARDLTGAVSSIKADELEDQPFVAIDQALQGKVSGVTISQNSGAPGGGISVRVRGVTSLTGSNEPLYVVDGVPIDGNSNNDSFSFATMGGESGQTKVSALSTINPNDITSIEVLKDASATAIYGSRASNGVILITTKSGEKGKSKISYDGYYGVQQITKYLDVMDLPQYAEYLNEVRVQDGQDPKDSFLDPSLLGKGTDWQEEVFRIAPITNHQLSVSGGSEKTKVYSSFNYYQQDGILINTDYERFALRLNMDHQVNDWLKIGNTITASNGKENIAYNDSEDGVIMGALRQSPEVPVYNSDGSWGGPIGADGVGSGGGGNPVAWSSIRSSYLERNKVLGTIYSEISFLKDFKLRSELGYDFNFNQMSSFNPSYEIGDLVNETGTSFKYNTNSFYWIMKNFLTYSKKFGVHNVTVMAGHEGQHSDWEQIQASRGGFLTNDLTALSIGDSETAGATSMQNQWAMQSAFARANYSFNNKYLLTGTFRADASSNFGPNNKWGYFPSFSAGWVVSEEPFMESLKGTLDWVKIRAGYGEVGNQNIGAYAYGQSLATINSAYGSAFIPGNIANPDVKWETTTSTNLGLELGFFNNRINMDADFYIKKSKDFLYQLPMAYYYGREAFSAPYVNLGEMSNKGFDLSINTVNTNSSSPVKWNSSIVFSMYRNELTKLADENSTITQVIQFNQTVTQTSVGNPIGQFYGYVTDGLFTSMDELNNAPSQGTIDENNGVWLGDYKFKDVNDDGVIDDNDRTIIGSPHPDFTFSLSNNLSYKNLDLAFSLYGSYGNDIINWTRKVTEGMTEPYGNQSVKVANRYTSSNTDTDMPRYVSGDPNSNARVSDRYVEDGSFLRIQNITLGYTLPEKWIKKTGIISNLRAYATIQNLHTFTNYSGYDPDIGGHSNNALLAGIDNGRYPVPRTYLFGLKLDF